MNFKENNANRNNNYVNNNYEINEIVQSHWTSNNKSKRIIMPPFWLLFLMILFLVTCSKDNQQSTPNFKNVEFCQNDISKIVVIGNLINGKPEFDESLRGVIAEGILNESYTYKRLFEQGTIFAFDINTLEMYSVEINSGVYYLIIRGKADCPKSTEYFIIAYELVFDSQGSLYNMSKTQHVCKGIACDQCNFNFNGNNIIGCKACPEEGKCDHTSYTIADNGYLIIPISIRN